MYIADNTALQQVLHHVVEQCWSVYVEKNVLTFFIYFSCLLYHCSRHSLRTHSPSGCILSQLHHGAERVVGIELWLLLLRLLRLERICGRRRLLGHEHVTASKHLLLLWMLLHHARIIHHAGHLRSIRGWLNPHSKSSCRASYCGLLHRTVRSGHWLHCSHRRSDLEVITSCELWLTGWSK